MLNYIFACCHTKTKNKPTEPNTITIDSMIVNEQNNTENKICSIQSFTNQNKSENIVHHKTNTTNINEKNSFINDKPPILQINNINNINIKLDKTNIPNMQIKPKENKEENSNNDNSSNNIKLSGISGENGYNRSFVSFSNLTIKYNNNNHKSSSLYYSDTEVISSCEICLKGEIFFNKEIRIDRTGIKGINHSGHSPDKIRKNKIKKACEIKFGILNCENNKINKDLFIRTISQNSNSNYKNKKLSKLATLKDGKKHKQSFSSYSSYNAKTNLDVILNISSSKITKKLQEKYGSNENILVFTIKYDINGDLFQIISMNKSIPLEILLDFNYPLRFNYNYSIHFGCYRAKIKVEKNKRNESIICINIEEGKEEKSYKFNPFENKLPITIGRNNCDINLNNVSISKLHAQIDYIYDFDEFFIIDCKSTNGTYLILKNLLNSFYIKRDHIFKIFDSKFKLNYTNFDN